ncbi:RmlC-like cupin domain-containing protein [Myxozyma melibiosi]|uniref:RmlC-like cupin domain-containing protein n=1 Tax=Myxozyma melibiosi TaxID=54550 RepID=A0ABR1FAJ5_9ASCO
MAAEEPAAAAALISALNLLPHIEGGYFVETDRDPISLPSPFEPDSADNNSKDDSKDDSNNTRNRSTLIYYLLTRRSPLGRFHRNKGRTIHLLHSGRARYVLVHPDGSVETFVVGHDVANGERLQWIVEGGDYKASFLLPDDDTHDHCLISEVVIPGFDYRDHNFLSSRQELVDLAGEQFAKDYAWLLTKPATAPDHPL